MTDPDLAAVTDALRPALERYFAHYGAAQTVEDFVRQRAEAKQAGAPRPMVASQASAIDRQVWDALDATGL